MLICYQESLDASEHFEHGSFPRRLLFLCFLSFLVCFPIFPSFPRRLLFLCFLSFLVCFLIFPSFPRSLFLPPQLCVLSNLSILSCLR